MRFSLIICGYNEEDNLDLAIQSCLNQNYPKDQYEVIYVDNNSKDRSLEIAKKYPIKVFTEIRQGPSEARNLGIKKSVGEVLIFLDADIKLHKDYLSFHKDTFSDKNHQVGAGGGKVLPLVDTWVSNYLGVSLFENYPRFSRKRYLLTYPSCNLLVLRSVLERIGYFVEKFENGSTEIPRSEDKELCQRIRKGGYLIKYNPNSIVYHKNRATFKELLKVWFCGAKSRVFLIKKNKNDPFTVLFRFNIPLVYLFVAIVTFIFSPVISCALFVFGAASLFFLAIKACFETGLVFQSIFIKPWMDALSLVVINLGVIYFRWKKY